eukprot:scaffold24152_cov146-Isochrysis_galbana.AAC.1
MSTSGRGRGCDRPQCRPRAPDRRGVDLGTRRTDARTTLMGTGCSGTPAATMSTRLPGAARGCVCHYVLIMGVASGMR